MSSRPRPFGRFERVLGPRTLRRLAGAILVGALAGWALVRGEQALGIEPPQALPFDPESARTLLSALVGGLITLAGFTFWMRSIVVQLISTQVSPRVLSAFLEDRFQENLLAFMMAAVVFAATVLGSLPEEGQGSTPALSVLAVLVVGLAALTALLYAMRSGIRTMQVGELIRRIAERGEQQLASAGDPRPQGPIPSREPDGTVQAEETGWLALVDYRAMEKRIPDGTLVTLDVEPGSFVTEGTRVGRVWTSDEADPELGPTLASYLALTRTRDEVERYASQVDWLVDIAERAISPTAVESATVHEVASHLGWLMERAIAVLPDRETEPTGNLLLPGWATNEEVTREAFSRLARNDHPSVMRILRGVLQDVLVRSGGPEESLKALRTLIQEVERRMEDAGDDGQRTSTEGTPSGPEERSEHPPA